MKAEQIIDIVVNVSGLNKDAIFTKSRKEELVKARQFIHYFIKYNTKFTLGQIQDLTSHKQHSIVLHSINEIDKLDFNKWQPYLSWKQEIQLRIDNFEFTGKKLIEIKNCSECNFYFNSLCELISEEVLNNQAFLSNCPLKNA